MVPKAFLPLLAPLLVSCASGTAPEACARDFSGRVCLDLDRAGGLLAHRAVIEEEVARTLSAMRSVVEVTDLRISVIADPAQVIPEVGMGGFNPGPGEVRIYGDPERADLAALLRAELPLQLAHETHHALRRRSVGYGTTLFEAAVTEGLADHFALEVTDHSRPPWTLALDSAGLATWTPRVLESTSGPYDHRAWFLGTDPSIPRWTGYSVGFDLVGRHLEQDSARRASALVDEPAQAFMPGSP